MPAKLTLHPPQRAPRFVILRDGEGLEIGRDPTCGLVVADPRVSKRHARLRWVGPSWWLDDCGSKNGTTLNGTPPGEHGAELRDGDWICLGGLVARFERLSAAQAAVLESERLTRLQTSAVLRRRLGSDLAPLALLVRLLELAMDVAGAERGFVLVMGPDGRLRPEAAAGFAARDVQDERFRGSVGAVREALASGLLVVSDAIADPRLGKRPSVVTQGIRSLACLPLRHGGALLGALYVDSRKPGATLGALDLETLETLADRAAALLAPVLPAWRAEKRPRPADGEIIAQLRQRFEELLTSA